MPDFSTPSGTTQPYIPAIKRDQRNRVPGTNKGFADATALTLAVDRERLNIGMTLPVWYAGERIQVLDEPAGVERRWTLSTAAGSPSADAAASHARSVLIGTYVRTMVSDTNRVRSTTGAPISGVGIDGDLALDSTAGKVYERSSGTWAEIASLKGGGAVSVANNGALVAGGETVAPAYLGVRTPSQITAIHAAIADGTQTYPGGSSLIDEAGKVLVLKGLGTAARFTETASAEIKVTPIRSGSFEITQEDSGATIPVSNIASATLDAGLTGFMAVIQREDNAEFELTAGAGVTMWQVIADVATEVTSVAITQRGQMILIRPSAAEADTYYISVGG